ncbi:apolipoprotein C-IV [Orycteropus afer afer]|uniref:Apolipoprotein C-IV n=1 Tax=Orycteropus afer afer TaxID=1230840 RepID=A0A8B7A1L3_ORYAF|nr:apolipoprotein C-IV [Orycteropus afer afer]
MSLPGSRLWVLPFLCFCILLLACTGGEGERGAVWGPGGWVELCQDDGPSGTPGSPTPKLKESRWSQVQSRMKELWTKSREKWQWFWGPKAFQGFVQTYYDDHLKNLGTRTKTWLQNSKDALLEKAHSLCPRLLCKDED